jgi:hypothetical protein
MRNQTLSASRNFLGKMAILKTQRKQVLMTGYAFSLSLVVKGTGAGLDTLLTLSYGS